MTGLPSTATVPRPKLTLGSPTPSAALPSGHGQAGPEQRQRFLSRAEDLHGKARLRAEEGDIEASARLILQALDCERRAGGLGPQVLQLIKPRG
ncbi:MAG: hypothetical protein ACKOZW_14655 [Cyanobium sp.]